jgi:hypothetical protein
MSRIRFQSALAALVLAASVSYGSGITQAQVGSNGALPFPGRVAANTASTAGTASIPARVDGTAGSRAESPASTLSVTIYGSDSAESGDYQCYFWAVASGGNSSNYSYSWSVISGSAWGSASGDSWTGGGTSDFTLRVTVSDGSGQASDTHFVDVVPSGSPLAQCFH